MKIKKLFILLLVALSAVVYGCEPNGNNPDSLLKEAGLKIDNYSTEYRSDNLERGQSAWDSYYYRLRLPSPDDSELVGRLDGLVKSDPGWRYDDETNRYEYHRSKDEVYELGIYVETDSAMITIDYMEYNMLF